MEFKQPELLYALFLLLIPLAVHLFQLRRFQKEDFTNVKFLKKVIRQTRKSSRLKKWLVLVTRMLMLASLILAFAQPYFPAKNPESAQSDKLIFLDNSYSMQATGQNGELLSAAVQDLIKNLPENEEISFFTHNTEFRNLSAEELITELQNLDFAENSSEFNTLNLRAKQLLKNSTGNKNLIFISDFQQNLNTAELSNASNLNYHIIPAIPENTQNISLDSVFISNRETSEISLQVLLSSTAEVSESVSISVYNGEALLAKTAVNFEENQNSETSFKINAEEISNGIIKIEDASLAYDNSLFFSLNKLKPAEVVGISQGKDATFLSRILTPPEFNTTIFEIDQLDFNRLNDADLVILNELKVVSGALESNLLNLQKNAVPLVIIPSESIDKSSYNNLLNRINAPTFSELKTQETLITDLAFDHPLLTGVFEERIDNFDYPKVQTYYNMQHGNKVISFQNNSGFLLELDNVFLFSAALNPENSNFRNSPLIVPVFYNMGLTALKTPDLYYETGKENEIKIQLQTQQDEVVHIVSETEDFIPQQRVLGDNLEILTSGLEIASGNYSLEYKNENQGYISFNSPRVESELEYTIPQETENVEIHSSIGSYFNEIKAAGQSNELWKCFVIFALIFLSAEMLLLKYLK
ncbi:BatA domain-containing protein [Salegentibacter salegens]|uniref:N-terminal double-transmembrane domain-containing protein n=1 Tax=Salegentibacter salegens TaxID=143223 RepID=A0A1M7IRY2_9FLAO|nr:BatA domain-containing protein [Salegentibacter salegens]PRX49787.1 putative membrane protein (TIGR02226 family) [Salegentibacter salegens]SHM43552.1 N-terminal double-transmembrane domain-containing protein [Salegentibacter salegens]